MDQGLCISLLLFLLRMTLGFILGEQFVPAEQFIATGELG